MSSISLDEHCGDLLTVRKTDRANSGVIYETCESSDGPVIFTGHSRNIWVDFVANKNSSGRGFQISFLTIEDELGYLVDAIVNEDKIDSFDGRPTNNNMSLEVSCRGCVIATDFFPVQFNHYLTNFKPLQDKHLLSRLLLLLNPNYSATTNSRNNRRPSRRKKPKINVIEGTHSNSEDFDHDSSSSTMPEQENIHPLSSS